MRWRNKIYIFCAFFIEFPENFRQSMNRDILTVIVTAYLLVLAVNATERATAEKYGAWAAFSADKRFFEKMKPRTRYAKRLARPAVTAGIINTLSQCAAISRAEITTIS